jgi:hypothetical protein
MTDRQDPAFHRLSWDEVNQPYTEGEYTEQRDAHIHDRPEWQVWAFFGDAKFHTATQRLHYLGESGGLYLYRDLRDGEEYSVPTFERVKEHFKDQRLAAVHNAASGKNWKLGWQLWGLALVVMLLLMIIVNKATPVNHAEPMNTLAVIWFTIFLVGGLGLALGRSGSKLRPRALPPHRMFFTDEELAQMQRQQNTRDAIALAVVAGYAAHKYHEHSQDRLAHKIAEEERGHGLHGSEWHQH